MWEDANQISLHCAIRNLEDDAPKMKASPNSHLGTVANFFCF